MLISSYKLDCDVVIKIMLSAYLNFSDNSSSDTKSTGIGLTLQRLSHNKTTWIIAEREHIPVWHLSLQKTIST